MKTCTECGTVKPLSDFHRRSKRPDGRNTRCKTCISAYMAARHLTRVDVAAAYGRERKYGVTQAQYDDMRHRQGNRCAICRTDQPGAKGWHVDHDHTTGVVRGLLCQGCNLGLGQFRDNPEALAAAIIYLKGASDEQVTTGPHDAS